VVGADDWWRAAANSWQVAFGPAGAAGGAERVSADGSVVGFTPEHTAKPGLPPSVSGSVASYRGLWPHVNLTERVTSAGVTEDLELTGPGAAASYAFGLSGAAARPNRSGGLDLSFDGKTVGSIPAPTVVAADRRTAGADAKLTVANGQVTVSVSPRWLASLPKTAFPVVIDPSFFPTTSAFATQIEKCSAAGGCTHGSAGFGQSSGVSWDSAVFIPFPQPPAVTAGQQGWQPAFAQLVVDCQSCLAANEIFGDDWVTALPGPASAEPSSYVDIAGGDTLFAGSGTIVDNITSWFPGHVAGSWFGVGGDAWKVDLVTGNETPIVVPLTASDFYVTFTYYQEPPAPAITSLAAKSVVATTTPTLVASIADPAICQFTNQADSPTGNGGSVACDSPDSVSYDFKISTSPVAGAGQTVADSGWIPQPYTTGTTSTAQGFPITTTPATWTVPPGALTDGVTYYATVQDADSNQNPEQAAPLDPAGELLVPPAMPQPAVSFTVRLRLGNGGPSPTDVVGAPPGRAAAPSQGTPSPGTIPSSETVNMVTGDLSLALATPFMGTLAGPAGVTLTYNSLQSSTATGSDYGLTGSFYLDSGSHVFPATAAGTLVEPDIDMAANPNAPPAPPTGGIPAGGAYLARWQGTITLPPGMWELGGLSAGGMRVFLDGSATPVFSDWAGGDTGPSPVFSGTHLSGIHQIEVDAWEGPGLQFVQLWANNVTSSPAVPAVVGSAWLTPRPTGLPPGWSLGSTTAAWTSVTDMGTQVVLHSPSGGTATFVSNGDGTFSPQVAADTDSLTEVNGQVQVATSNGYLYQFNAAGQLTSMTSITDDLRPASLKYQYGPEPGAPAIVVLQSITDPVSGRSITLSYGSTATCSAPNTAGLLCGISYWDGTSASFVYNSGGELAEVLNPDGNATLFGYDSVGRMSDIRDALANDVLAAGGAGVPACSNLSDSCVLDTWIGYDSAGRVSTVTQPQPAPGQARPQRTYSYAPAANNPGAGVTHVSIAGFSPAAAGASPAGAANTVGYDSQSRVVSQTNSTGLAGYTTWDSQSRPIIAVDSAGEQTSTVYDLDSNVTGVYGPAPVACFDPSTVPTGVTPQGPATGYLPLANSATASGCGVAVPHTHYGYDEGMPGLADTYWSDGGNAGAPTLHGTGNGGTPHSTCAGYGIQVGTTSDTDLCATWPAGTTPPGVTTDAAGKWSLRMAGDITTPTAGDWIFCVADTQNFTMSIDGQVALTNEEYEWPGGDVNFDFQGTYLATLASYCNDAQLTQGQHTIRIDMQGSPAQVTSYNVGYVPPGASGAAIGLPLSMLSPGYGLKTSATDPDGNTTTYGYSDPAHHIGPEFGLLTSSVVDPGGLALTSSTAYEDPTQGGYGRQTVTTLPAGGQTGYTYYTGTGGPVAAACGVTASTPQGGQLEQRTDPAPGGGGQARVEQFIYTAAGRDAGLRVGSAADVGSQPWQCVSYDARGRISSQTWPATASAPARTVSYAYAVGGNPLVSSVTDATGTITSTVDLLGRAVSYTDVWGETTTVSYNQAGQVTGTSGLGMTAQYGYDPDSAQPTTTTVNGTLLATASYNTVTGLLASVSYANNTEATLGYDAYGRQDSLSYAKTSTGQVIATDSAGFSLGGNETSETTSQAGGSLLSISYGYDHAGRLTSAADTAGGTGTSSYGYAANPAADNCASPGEGANTNRTQVATPAGTTDYCYNAADQLTATISNGVTNTGYRYSEDGDQLTDNGTTYTWDAADRVATATTAAGQSVASSYDAVNRLVQSSASGGSTVRYSYPGFTDSPAAVLDTAGHILQQFAGLPGGVSVTLQSSGNVWSYANLQGDTTITADGAGNVTSGPRTYDPWGNLIPGQPAAANMSGPNVLGGYGAEGKLTNSATGTILLGARTYNPGEARFLSVDPHQGGCANSYTYAFGNPLTHSDLTGMGCGPSGWDLFFDAVGVLAFFTGVGDLIDGAGIAIDAAIDDAAASIDEVSVEAATETASTWDNILNGIGIIGDASDAKSCLEEHVTSACVAAVFGITGTAASLFGADLLGLSSGTIATAIDIAHQVGQGTLRTDLNGVPPDEAQQVLTLLANAQNGVGIPADTWTPASQLAIQIAGQECPG